MSGTTIAEQVGEIKQQSAGAPQDASASVFAHEQEELARGGVPTGIPPAGSVLPDAELQGADGAPRLLSQAVGDGFAVLVFYRGAWCPYCNIALQTYQAELLPALSRRGVRLVAISPQSPDGSLTMREKHELEFAVLSDPGNTLAKAAGILTEPSAEVREAQLGLGLDLTAANADGTAGIPMPTTAIVDAALTIRWIDVHPDYTTRSEPEQILAALDGILAGHG